MENYINSIFEKQSETDIKTLIQSYGTENGIDTTRIDEILKSEENFCAVDPWGGLRYNRGQIRSMLNQL